MGNVFKRFDIVGQEFEINFGRSRRLQTSIGGALTTISVVMVAIASLNFVINYWNTKNAEVSISKEFDPKFPKINMIDSKMSPVIGFLQNNQNFMFPKDGEKYFTIHGMILQVNYESLVDFKMEMTPLAQIPFKPCSELESTTTKWYLNSDMVNAKNFSKFYGYCAEVENPELFFVEGDIVAPPQTVFIINIFPCSLEDPTKCATPQELFQFNMYLSLPKFSFDREDLDDPVKMTPSVGLTTPINYGLMKKREIWLKKNAVYDDRVDFAKDSLNSEYFEIDGIERTSIPRMGTPVHCTKEQIMMSQCQPYVVLQFGSSGKFVKIKRSYKKLLNVLGEIGGAAKVFFIGSSVAFYILGRFFIKKKKAQEILGMEVKEAKTIMETGIFDESKDECFWKIFKEFQVENHNGYEIIKNLNKYKVLDEILFEEYHRKLVPLLLLNKTKEKMKKKERNIIEEKKELTIEEAVKLLSSEESDDPLKQKLKIFFLENLPHLLTNKINKNEEVKIGSDDQEIAKSKKKPENKVRGKAGTGDQEIIKKKENGRRKRGKSGKRRKKETKEEDIGEFDGDHHESQIKLREDHNFGTSQRRRRRREKNKGIV